MADLWREFGLWHFVALVAVVSVLGGMIGSLAKNWRKAHESEHLAALKQSMVEKGMSAEDIERVINAGRPSKACGDD
jgi:hypothetical protein